MQDNMGASAEADQALVQAPSPTVSALTGFDPSRMWHDATAGREGYCSRDLQDAAIEGIRSAYLMGLSDAVEAASMAALPDNYQWSEDNLRKFLFGVETAIERINAIAIEARSDETAKHGSAEGESAAIAQGVTR